MATAGSLLANIRIHFGDPDRDLITDAVGLEWLSMAEQRLCHDVLALDEIKDYPVVARQKRYDLPTNCILPFTAQWWKNSPRNLAPADPSEMDQYEVYRPLNTSYPTCYSVIRKQVVLGPGSPISDSATALASGDWGSTATTIGFTAASGTFRSRGWLENQTTGEVIEYTNIASTTVTGCSRGVHGTSGASIASAQQWKEIDLQVRYRKTPALLTATTQSPEVPAAFHRYLEQFVLFLAWRASGDKAKAEAAYNQWKEEEKTALQTVSRRVFGNKAIKDRRHFYGYRNVYGGDDGM